MNVLHINQSDIGGGAAIAGYRLHQGLLQQGVNSRLLVGQKQTDDPQIAQVQRRYRVENWLQKLTHRVGFNYVNLISSFDIPKHPFFAAADIANFHNLHTGYFNYLAISHLAAQKPIVFTLHDMWSFTGHCAYSYDCDRWQTGCGQCPFPNIYPAIRHDTTRWEWKLKDWVYSRSNLTIVTLSNWLTVQVKASMLNQFPIHHIPNGIDTDVYKPLSPELCRATLGIPLGKKVLLFIADDLRDSRKGGDLLIQALQRLPPALKQDCLLLTLGKPTSQLDATVEMAIVNLGYVSSDRLKSIAYSAADLFVFPTRADNLPLVLQESMACGTPMVSFNVGGVPDLVRSGITGYLAEIENSQSLQDGIVQLLEDEELRVSMSKNCREIAVQEYSLELQSKRYIELYQKILERGSN